MDVFWSFLKIWSLWLNSVTRQINFKRTKIDRKCHNWKMQKATFWVIFEHCGISIHWWILLQVVVWLHYKREERGDIWRGGCKSCHNNNGNFTHICLDNPFLPYNDETSNDYTLPKKSWVGNIRWVPTNQKPLPLLFMKWTANQTPSNPRIPDLTF